MPTSVRKKVDSPQASSLPVVRQATVSRSRSAVRSDSPKRRSGGLGRARRSSSKQAGGSGGRGERCATGMRNAGLRPALLSGSREESKGGLPAASWRLLSALRPVSTERGLVASGTRLIAPSRGLQLLPCAVGSCEFPIGLLEFALKGLPSRYRRLDAETPG